jgi:hypothetical protein
MNPIQRLIYCNHILGLGRFVRIVLFSLIVSLPASASNILYLVGNLTLVAGDAAVKTTLESMGHVVTTKLGTASVTADAATTNLVLISSSIASTDVAAKFKTVTQPVFVSENGIFDDMAMTGTVSGTDFGTTLTQTQIVIQVTGHQMSAGLTGTQTITTATRTINFGKPGTGAIKLANQVGDATKLAIFGYDVGGVMVGLNAPGRRVGFFFADDSPNALTAAGTSLFKAAISWALNIVPPTITTQPANISVTAGATAAFTVVPAGTAPLTYQWRKAGVNISGATAASYTTPATVVGDNGALFSVVITNSAGTVTSANATLTVNTLPTITTQPISQTVTVGATATFNVVATGTAPLTYQWRKNAVNITGATLASYTTPATVAGDNGALFSVVVSNVAGTVTSANATLTVNSPPTFTVQPASITVNENQTALFNVTVTGTAPFTYQWKKGGTAIPGATLASYTTPATTMLDSNSQFTCTVTNAVGAPTSNPAILTVKGLPPVLNPVVSNSPVNDGASAVFSITQTGTPPFTYQWQRNAANIGGAVAASYTLTPARMADNNVGFRCVVTGRGGIATSNASILVVNPLQVVFVKQPETRTVYEGQKTTFGVSVTGTTGFTFQWQRNSINIAGALDSNYSTPNLLFSDSGALYRCVVTNPAGSLASQAAMIHVRPYSHFPVSQWIGVSAELRDDLGNLVGKGSAIEKDMVVKLFTNLTGGTSVYQEDFTSVNGQPIKVKDGYFTLYLGSGVSTGNLNQILTANPSLFAEVSIGLAGSQETLSPRTPVTAPAYQGAPQILQGIGNPTQQAPAGTYYENTVNGSVWLKLPVRWTQVSN